MTDGGHMLAGRMTGASGVVAFCTCGLAFFAFSRYATREAESEARDKADQLQSTHQSETRGRGPFILEEDRFLVLLVCGEWTQTRRPEDATWWCKLHGEQPAALDNEGRRAVLHDWKRYSQQEGR